MSKSGKRRGLRVGFLAGAVAAALSVAGISAGAAAAAPTCAGGPLLGQGASLQKEAQNNETNGWTVKYNEACGAGKVEYLATGSGSGLRAWWFSPPSEGEPFLTSRGFTASDDAPTSAQIAQAQENAKAGGGEGTNVLVIPVAQTSIAAVVNPPEGCGVEEILNQQLEEVMRGTTTKWKKLTGLYDIGEEEGEEPTCTNPGNITRVVRKDGSGTTYQFKNYLNQINSAPRECVGGRSWGELTQIGAGEEPNITWPEQSTCLPGERPVSPVVRPAGKGGTEVVKTVNSVDGSIGYSALPDIENNRTGDTVALKLQNNGRRTHGATFAKAGFGADKSANCASARYDVPEAAQPGVGSGLNVEWSQTFGANIDIASKGNASAYPLCTITFDMALDNYSGVKNALGETYSEEDAAAVQDYLANYVTAEDGQNQLATAETWYSRLPTSHKAKFDVLGAAEYAAGQIGY